MYKERRIISASARRPLKAVRERDDSEGNDTMLMRGPNDWFVRPNRAGFRSNKSPTGTVNTISAEVRQTIMRHKANVNIPRPYRNLCADECKYTDFCQIGDKIKTFYRFCVSNKPLSHDVTMEKL
jgi:hypothetical protein